MAVKQGRFYLRHNTLSEDIPIVIIFKVRLQVPTENDKKPFLLYFRMSLEIWRLRISRNGKICGVCTLSVM